ncbi:hypothetical protein QJQ45_018369, partial [Haematococcus lacustris]
PTAGPFDSNPTAGPSDSSPAADPSDSSSNNKSQPADIGSGLADEQAFQFDSATRMGMGLDPGAIQTVSAALGVWDEDGCLDSFIRSKLTRSQVQHDSGLIQARLNSQRCIGNVNLELQHLAAATSVGTSLVAIKRHVAITLATWDAVWEEYLHPKWAEQKMRLHGAQEKVLERYFKKLEEEAAIESQKRWGNASSRWCSSATQALAPGVAWSKRFEAQVRGLMWCPQLHQATPGDLDNWVDRDCNAALDLQRAGESKWRPLELCRWQHRGAAPAKGKEYPAMGLKKLRDRAPKAQAQQPQQQQQQQQLQQLSMQPRRCDARFGDWAGPCAALLPSATPELHQQQFLQAQEASLHQPMGCAFDQQQPTLQPGPLATLQLQAPQCQAQSQGLQSQRPAGQLLGWGGQALPGAERGRGRSAFRGRGGGSRGSSGSRARRAGDQHADVLVAQLLATLRALPSNASAQHVAAPVLAQLDSRSVAALLRNLLTHQMSARAWEIFNWLRRNGCSPDGSLQSLADVYSYTAMISSCSSARDLDVALELSREMAARGIPRNVHTFSALMNVAIKASQNQLALEVYAEMQQAGCAPNLVTYNTLIDVYGKLGQWTEAMRTLAKMRSEGIQPVVRTLNTLMIACNSSNQWQETLQVYEQLLGLGLQPNTTTYNALISAYSKSGQLDKVLQVYREMVAMGCERSVITYSTLISACERAGQWQMALQLFNRMPQDGCPPNTITYNSLITACAQGAQWEQATEVFDQMQRQGCTPDVVTHTALITAYGKGGQWRRALQVFERMHQVGCKPDHVIYKAVVEALWDTGLQAAQHRAVALYRQGVAAGCLLHTPPELPDVSLGAVSSSVAMINMLCWLADLREKAVQEGPASLPDRVVLRVGKGRQREFGSFTSIRTVAQAWLQLHRAPFTVSAESNSSLMRLEAAGVQLADWLDSPGLDAALQPYTSAASSAALRPLQETSFDAELVLEVRCHKAFQVVQEFEESHGLSVATMGQMYITSRRDLVLALFKVGASLGVGQDALHDAVLLMDRAMSSEGQIRNNMYLPALLTALIAVTRHPPTPLLLLNSTSPASSCPGRGGEGRPRALSEGEVSRLTGVTELSLQTTEATLRAALADDLSTLSAIHSLRLFHQRLASNEYSEGTAQEPGSHSHLDGTSAGTAAATAGIARYGQLASQQPDQGVAGSSSTGASPSQSRSMGTGVRDASSRSPGSSLGAYPYHSPPSPPSPTCHRHGSTSKAAGSSRRDPLVGSSMLCSGMSGYAANSYQAQAVADAAAATQAALTQLSLNSGPSGSLPAPPGGATVAASLAGAAGMVDILRTGLGGGEGGGGDTAFNQQQDDLLQLMASGSILWGQSVEQDSYALLNQTVMAPDFLNFRPSITAAAVLYTCRMYHGQLPLWPSVLALMTGYNETSTPELAVAINAAQRLLRLAPML